MCRGNQGVVLEIVVDTQGGCLSDILTLLALERVEYCGVLQLEEVRKSRLHGAALSSVPLTRRDRDRCSLFVATAA